MANINKSKIIRIWGVTLPELEFRFDHYGHGVVKTNKGSIAYVDIFIDDLVIYIKAQGLKNKIIKKLT